MVPDPDELIEVFDLFMLDKSLEIKEGILENLPLFVSTLADKEHFVI